MPLPRYRVELLDTETDEVMDVAEFTAANDHDAQCAAVEEAQYQGYHAGSVTRIEGENK